MTKYWKKKGEKNLESFIPDNLDPEIRLACFFI